MNLEERNFYKNLAKIVGPMAVQNLISSAVSSADVIMLAYVGQIAIAASSLAGQIQFIMFMIVTGLSSGLVMLCAQYWGKKDLESIKTLVGIGLRISCFCGLIFSIASFFFPELLMKIFTNDKQLIETGAVYLRFVSISYLCISISQVFQAGFKSIERVTAVTVITTSALLLNIVLNAVFIFGLFGFPKLGIKGVALATSISRVLELLICQIYAFTQKDIVFSPLLILRKNKYLTVDFLRYSLPALGNELVWGAAWSTYSVIMGHLGAEIVAANSVVSTIRNLCSVLIFGMSYGGAVVLGKYMGAGELELAERNAARLVKSTLGFGVLASVIFVMLKPLLPYVAALDEIASHYRDIMIYINAFSMIGATVNTVLICGVFRSGGDSKFGFFADGICMWFVSVPLGLISAFILKLPPIVVYGILYFDEFEKMGFVVYHYFKKTWLKNITR